MIETWTRWSWLCTGPGPAGVNAVRCLTGPSKAGQPACRRRAWRGRRTRDSLLIAGKLNQAWEAGRLGAAPERNAMSFGQWPCCAASRRGLGGKFGVKLRIIEEIHAFSIDYRTWMADGVGFE